MPPGSGSAAGETLALPYHSHRGLCASMGTAAGAQCCVSLSAFSLLTVFVRGAIDDKDKCRSFFAGSL